MKWNCLSVITLIALCSVAIALAMFLYAVITR
jgi:hypothetical protein